MLKDPAASLDFTVDWTAWLDNEGDTVGSFDWTVPEGLTEVAKAADGGRSTVWISGGTAGQRYMLTCRITTGAGRVDERTITVDVRNR